MLDWPARLLLSPVLLTQALRIRCTAQMLPEAAGPRSGLSGTGPPMRLHIVGDSSAAGVGVDHQTEALSGQLVAALAPRATVSWTLDALTGATTKSTLARLQSAQPAPVDVVVTALGVNDITRLISPRRWRAQQDLLMQRLRTLYTPGRIYASGVPPLAKFPLLPHPLRWVLGRHAGRIDRIQRSWIATQPDITLLPFDQPLDPALMARDGFHPGPEIYRLWGQEMASRILIDWPLENPIRDAGQLRAKALE